jgi:deoxyribodipyrimidine photolyase-related protein
MLLYLLPNQLFEYKYIPKETEAIVLWEHPSFFTKYNFNKKKLLLHRASMKYYFDKLPIKKKMYIDFNVKHSKSTCAFYFDPINKIDTFTDQKYMLESPNFFIPKNMLVSIHEKKKSERISFTRYFYPRCKKHVDFLQNTSSTDHQNRETFTNKLNIKVLENNKYISEIDSNKYISEAIQYVNNNFKKNYGNTENFSFPIHHKGASIFLKHFIEHKLFDFGKYQDAFDITHKNMFHSMLSSSLNIGLINPRDILDQLKLVKNDIPLNSLEGYFRQLCWREFQRYCYIHYSYLSTRNYFSLKNPINKKWYEGTTNILPVDNCIKKAFDTGYLHHIERLMIIGNFMILSEIKPTHGHRWFMEFAIDSYEWVMLQNVYDMVFFNGNGLTSYKPYITSNNYLIKMSNYSKTKEWNDVWNSKYRSFLKKHTSKLYKYRYHFKLSAK